MRFTKAGKPEGQMTIMLTTYSTNRIMMTRPNYVNEQLTDKHTHTHTNKQSHREKERKQRGTLDEHSNGLQVAR